MGLLKFIFYLLIVVSFISGCARSVIKLSAKLDEEPFQMFGKTPHREFFVPVTVSDSLIEVWENSANGGFPNSSVAIYDEFIFINDLSGRIYCYNLADGSQVGKLKYKGAIYSTPVPYKSTLIFPVSLENDYLTELIYYDLLNGKEKELIEITGRVLTEMIALEDAVIFCTEFGSVYKYDLYGETVWETHTRIPIHSSPSMSGDKIIFGNDKGEIISLDEETGDSVYVSKIGGTFFSGSSVSDSKIYIGNENGFLYALNTEDGSIVWEFNTGARILMTPAIDSQNVIFGNLGGSLYSLNKFTGEKNWETKFQSVLNSTPLLTNNRIILPDVLLSFHLIDKSNGQILKTYKLDGRAKLSPVFYKDLLFIGYDDGILRAYEFVE